MSKYGLRGIFKPVDNDHGFDFREFDIVGGKPGKFVWLEVREAMESCSEIPVFKPKKHCISKSEWYGQFEKFDS